MQPLASAADAETSRTAVTVSAISGFMVYTSGSKANWRLIAMDRNANSADFNNGPPSDNGVDAGQQRDRLKIPGMSAFNPKPTSPYIMRQIGIELL